MSLSFVFLLIMSVDCPLFVSYSMLGDPFHKVQLFSRSTKIGRNDIFHFLIRRNCNLELNLRLKNLRSAPPRFVEVITN